MAKLTSTVPDAVPGFKVSVETLGLNIGQASRVEGLSAQAQVISYRGGNESHTVRKQKGLVEYSDITIERIYTNNPDTWALLGLVFEPTAGLLGLTSPIYKTDLIITFKSMENEEITKFFVKEAWLRGYEIGQIDANSSEYAIERVIFAHQGFTKIGVDL